MAARGRRLRLPALFALLLALLTAGLVSIAAAPAYAGDEPAFGTTEVSASSWMMANGGGVDVYSNGDTSNVTNDYSSPAVGMKWQCVELTQRLYQAKGWHSGNWSGVTYAYQIYDNASTNGLVAHPNDGSYTPVPGDMIIHSPGTNDPAGHVAVVDYVSGGKVYVAEQNVATSAESSAGRASYTIGAGNILSRDLSIGLSIRGIVHSPKNTNTNSPADSDGDGVPNTQDQCPAVAGSTMNAGCRKFMQPLTGDFNEDGRTDEAAFYNQGGGGVDLKLWTGNADKSFNQPTAAWSVPVGSGWDGTRIMPAGVGDINGDGHLDVVAFYRYDNAALGVNTWFGDGHGGFTYQQGWYIGRDWDGARIIPAGVADFNGDGRADVAAFYRYDNAALGLKIWYGNANGSYSAPTGPWYTPTDWDGYRVIPAGAGDFNGDGKKDIAFYYRDDNAALDIKIFTGDGAGGFTASSGWYTPTDWDGQYLIPDGTADFNGDGRSDLVAFYDFGGGSFGVKLWNGNADGTFTNVADPWYVPVGTGWYGARMLPSGTGDFNGDGKADLASFYAYDNAALGLDLWWGDGQNGASYTQPWYVSRDWFGSNLIP